MLISDTSKHKHLSEQTDLKKWDVPAIFRPYKAQPLSSRTNEMAGTVATSRKGNK